MTIDIKKNTSHWRYDYRGALPWGVHLDHGIFSGGIDGDRTFNCRAVCDIHEKYRLFNWDGQPVDEQWLVESRRWCPRCCFEAFRRGIDLPGPWFAVNVNGCVAE